MSIELVMLSKYLFLLPSIFPSIRIRVFSNESALLIRWPNIGASALASVQFSSVAQLCPALWDPKNCSMPGFPVHLQLLELSQTHFHQISDAIQPISSSVIPFSSCLQSFPASGFFPMSQLFASGGQSTGVSASDSVRFSRSVMSDSLRPLGLHYARLPCPSPTSRTYSNSSPSNRWCHPTISSYVIPFSSCLQSCPASGSFLMSLFFASGGQSIKVSASASVLPMNIQDWFPSGWTGWISLQSKGLSRVFSNTTVQKHQFFNAQPSFWSNSHIHTWLLEKP